MDAITKFVTREDIRDVVGTRYGRAMDHFDLDLLKSCFHADATLDYGYYQGNAHAWCERRILEEDPAVSCRYHYLFPAHVEIDGDDAQAESTSISGVRKREGTEEEATLFGARYFDRLQRRAGVWRMTFRQVKIDFAQIMPVSAADKIGMFSALPFTDRHLSG